MRYCVKQLSCPMGKAPRWERWNEMESFGTLEEAKIALEKAETEYEKYGSWGKFKIARCKY